MVVDVLSTWYQIYREQILDYMEAVELHPEDPENLHKLRTYSRRMRTILKEFKPYLDPDFYQQAKAFFKELMSYTNPIRDVDVFLIHLQQVVLPSQMQGWIDPVVTLLEKEQQDLYEKFLLYLPQFKEWFKDLNEIKFTHKSQIPFDVALKDAIKQRKKAIKKSKEEDLHRLRIQYKYLRYLYELAQEEKKIKKFKRIQDLLGEYHDYEVACEKIDQIREKIEDKKALMALGAFYAKFCEKKRKLYNQARKLTK